jgi:DNA mismatch repair ATPase MutL
MEQAKAHPSCENEQHLSSKLSLVSRFHKIVFLLIENSLFTSHASAINITVSFDKFWIEVLDNGERACNSETLLAIERYGNVDVKRVAKGSLNVIRVENIFEKYPLRRKTMKPRVEHSRIKEYILNISLLHYYVKWQMSIVNDINPEIVLQLPRSESVSVSAATKFGDVSAIISKTEVCFLCMYVTRTSEIIYYL